MKQTENYFGLILGPSGSGKGYTIAAILEEYSASSTFVTGDWCRNHQEELASAGALVGDDLITAAGVEAYGQFKKLHKTNPFNFFIDAPRSLEQAKAFCDYFMRWGASSLGEIVTLHIHAEPKICRDRIEHRAELQGRPDDAKPKVIRRRLGYYYGVETPGSTDDSFSYINQGGVVNDVVPWLKENTNYHLIDGNLPLEDIRNIVKLCVLPQLFSEKSKSCC